MNPTIPQCSGICAALMALVCGLWGCGSNVKKPIVDASGPDVEAGGPSLEAGGFGVEAGVDSGTIDAPTCPASCDDKNDCTIDSCDRNTFQCVHTAVADGQSCEGKPCTTNSLCQGGLCLDGPFKKCTASDQCHAAGTCIPATGECDNPPIDGIQCDDGNKCTYGDQCTAGVCAGTPIVCGGAGTCDPNVGICPNGFPTALAGWSFDNATWPTNGSGLIGSPDGQIFAAGSYFAQIDLGTGPLVQSAGNSPGISNVFLARLDPDTLKATWAVTFPDSNNQGVTSFAVNGAGQLGVVGSLQGAITVAGNEVDALYVGDQYILAASTTDGTGSWARRLNLQSGKADGRNLGLRAIAGDPQGISFVVCGTVACATGPMRGDAGPNPNPAKDLSPSLVCQGGTDLVVARIDRPNADGGSESGNEDVVWASEVGGINDENCGTLMMDAGSNTYVVGNYRFGSEVTFGTTTLPMVDQTGTTAWMYLAKLDPNNNWVWAQSIGTGQQIITPASMIAVDSDVVLTGTISAGPLLLHEGLKEVVLDSPTFIARFDGLTGNLVWAQGLGNGSSVDVNSMTTVGGHVLLAGSYGVGCGAACALGAIPLPLPLDGGAFVAQVDGSSGAVVGAKGFGGAKYTNSAAGIVGLTGTDQSGSLVLLSYSTQLDLGAPIGILQTASTATSASCLARLGP